MVGSGGMVGGWRDGLGVEGCLRVEDGWEGGMVGGWRDGLGGGGMFEGGGWLGVE